MAVCLLIMHLLKCINTCISCPEYRIPTYRGVVCFSCQSGWLCARQRGILTYANSYKLA